MKLVKRDKRTKLDKEIDRVLSEMEKVSSDSEQYAAMVDNLEVLYKFKNENKNLISKDTIAIIAGNLLGIVLILGYEKANVITSKALGFVLKGRV
jgi:hypothetical protein